MRKPDLSNYEPVTPKQKMSVTITAPPSAKSPFMRAILSYPLASKTDTLQQFLQPNLPQFRFLQK